MFSLERTKPMSMQRTLTTDGLPVAIVGNSVQTATQISGGVPITTNSTSRDLWNIYVFNTSAEYVTLSVEIGGPHCTVTTTVHPSGRGVQQVITNLPLPRNASIKAYASQGNAVYMYGFAGSSVSAPPEGAAVSRR